jgi:uncharacterized protein (TIGR03067 family)
MAAERITSCSAHHINTNHMLMKIIRNTLLIGLVTAALLSTRADDNQAVKKDLAQLEGEWSMVSGTADGFPIPDAMLPNSKRVCKGDELTATVGGQLVMKAKITIDPTRKPKTIDYQVIDGPTKGKKHLGIYEVDGATMKSCFAAPGAERPADRGAASRFHQQARRQAHIDGLEASHHFNGEEIISVGMPYGAVLVMKVEDLLVERVLVSAYPQPNPTARSCDPSRSSMLSK